MVPARICSRIQLNILFRNCFRQSRMLQSRQYFSKKIINDSFINNLRGNVMIYSVFISGIFVYVTELGNVIEIVRMFTSYDLGWNVYDRDTRLFTSA